MADDLALDLRDTGKRLVPACFKLPGHEAVRRIGCIVLAEGAIGRVARGLQVALKSRAHLIALLASFLLGGDRGCDCTRTDNAEKRILHGLVHAQASTR